MLEVRGLRVALPDRSRKPVFGRAPLLEILKGIDLSVAAGETIGLVGESGSGKSTLARALLRLYRPSAGTIEFEGRDITALPESELRPLRARMQIVFQDSQSALNPRLTVGTALAEPFLSYGRALDAEEGLALAGNLLRRVDLPVDFLDRYPHQLSGGQRQRVGIARAIALNPRLVVADEIVSGLDVSVQAQILELLRTLRAETGMALVLISHDLSVVRALCERVLVMQHGAIVESGLSAGVFGAPQHPYTRKLLRAIPLPEVDPAWIDTVDVEET
jgi:peptide/nickel transport system ATP-binding protein